MDWIIVAGLMAISLVLCIGMLHLSGRIRMLEKEMKDLKNWDQKSTKEEDMPVVDRMYKELEEEVMKYNPSYGDPTYTEWIDKDYDSKGVK